MGDRVFCLKGGRTKEQSCTDGWLRRRPASRTTRHLTRNIRCSFSYVSLTCRELVPSLFTGCLRVTGEAKKEIKVEVEVFCFEQDNMWVAYCPAFDWTTYADTLEEAQAAFPEALAILLEDLIQQKTLEQELLRLGWKLELASYRPPRTKRRTINALGSSKSRRFPVVLPSVSGDSSVAFV